MPRAVLPQMLDQVDDDTAQGGSDAPVARLERPIAGLFDTVNTSLCKALLGIRGAVLAADAPTIAEAAG